MDWFGKAISWTLAIGFGLMGVYVGLIILRIALGVAGVMLGSGIGTILLAIFLWMVYKKVRSNFDR